ncbi:MAG: FAD-dependent oxidoreductase [Kiritimatiellia bacterium]
MKKATAPTINRPACAVPVWGGWDVVVAGGGIAGVAAALAAARNGARTCIVEKYAGLGGLATLGHVVVYLPICDGRGRQVSFGLAEELLKLPMAYSTAKPNGAWGDPASATREALAGPRYELVFDPGPMLIGLERLLEEAGVEIVYDTLIVDVARAPSGAISHLVVENKSGCGAFAAKVVVDCTGEADICFRCDEATETSDRNARAAWFYAINADRKIWLAHAVDPFQEANVAPGQMHFDGTDWRSVTRQIIESRKLILEVLAKRNATRAAEGQAPTHVFCAPAFHGFRMTRRLVADYTMTPADLHRWHHDAVGIFSDWRRRGPVYSLPYRSILAVKTPNLAAAGRCLSSTGDTWDVTRVIPVCAVSGEAAGTAAALAAASGRPLRDIPVADVQSALRRQGVRLDPELVGEG